MRQFSKSWMLLWSAMAASALLFATCKFELGEQPLGPSIETNTPPIVNPFDSTKVIVGTQQFHLYTSKTQLKADNSDTATIMALLINDHNAPAVGDTVVFSCNLGVIYPDSAAVDKTGWARVTLRSMKVNGPCIVKARAIKSGDTASTVITFGGITVRLESDATDLKINENATVTALLADGSGNPIGGDPITFTTSGGLFSNNAVTYTTLLDPSGRATINVTSKSASTIKVYAAALNTYDSIPIVYTNNAIGLSATPTTLKTGGTDEAQLVATFVDGSGKPMPNVAVAFSTNAGTITKASAVTDASGKAYSSLKSATFSGTATVVASTYAGNAVVKVTFTATLVRSIKLAISPDNIGVNGGVATLTATVLDSNNNMVSGANVNFRILKSPGGGENIDNPVVTTQNGIAHAQLFAGSVPSMYRACLVSASVGAFADTSKLTISGEPYAISVARPQSDTVTVPRAGVMNDATFDFFAGAVVSDINGNPVADGTRVNFSAVVSGMAVHQRYFVKWSGLGSTLSEKSAVMGYTTLDIPFEDINNNFHMDENDLKLDFNDAVASRGDDVNGDGVCDFNPTQHDLWIDFNGNGKIDAGSTSTPDVMQVPILKDTTYRVSSDTVIREIVKIVPPDTIWFDSLMVVSHLVTKTDTIGFRLDTVGFSKSYNGAEPSIIVDGVRIWADLYPNGQWDTTELVRDVNGNGKYDAPASGDRRWWELECLPYWFGQRFDFDKNDFGIAITTSAVTQGGVANAHLTYPRQLARRLIVSVNAEANGVRDRNGERFVLPVIVGN